MRKLALILLLPLCSIHAQIGYPSPPIIQSCVGAGTCVFSANVTAGDIVLCSSGWETSTNTPSVSDTRSSTWAQKVLDTSNSVKVSMYGTTLGNSGANTVTFSVSGAGFQEMGCVELPPNWSTTVDASAVATFSGTPNPVTTGSVTTTKTGDLLVSYIGGFVSAASFLQGTGFTFAGTRGGSDSMGQEIGIAGANGSTSATFQNKGGTSGVTLLVAFAPNAPAITSPATIPSGVLNQPYSYQLYGVGGTGTYTWAITSGALQTGLTLNSSTGLISGTPTSSSTASITMQITDGAAAAVTKALTLTVGGTGNSISVVQAKQGSTLGGGNIAYASNVTAGNLLFAGQTNATTVKSGAIVAPTDSRGTIYTYIGTTAIFSASTGSQLIVYVQLFAGLAAGSGANTVNFSNDVGDVAVIGEIANAQFFLDNFLLTSGTSAASNSTITSGSLTTLATNSILFSLCTGYSSVTQLTANSPFTAVGSAVNGAGGYDITTTATGYTVSYAQSGNTDKNWVLGMVGFRPTVGVVVSSKIRHSVTGGM